MSSLTIHQALGQVKWFTPQQIDEARTNRLIDERIYEVRKFSSNQTKKTKKRDKQ